jgi:hypothetical protein
MRGDSSTGIRPHYAGSPIGGPAGTASFCVAAVKVSIRLRNPLQAHNRAQPALTGVDNWLLVSTRPTPFATRWNRYPRTSVVSGREIVRHGKINSA